MKPKHKAGYKVGDLITIPTWVGGYCEMKTALVTEVREWEDEHSLNDPPVTWDYLVLTSDGKEVMFDHEVLLANPEGFVLLEAA